MASVQATARTPITTAATVPTAKTVVATCRRCDGATYVQERTISTAAIAAPTDEAARLAYVNQWAVQRPETISSAGQRDSANESSAYPVMRAIDQDAQTAGMSSAHRSHRVIGSLGSESQRVGVAMVVWSK